MAKIIINGITYRETALFRSSEADTATYEEAAQRILAAIGEHARAAGFDFEVDARGQGAKSYRVVDEKDEADHDAAHEWMQHESPNFWSLL